MAPRINPPGFALRGPPGRRYSDPFGQTILEMLQRDSEREYLASMELAKQAGEGWRTAGNILGSAYPAYQDLQARRLEEEDRQRALEDRERDLARQRQADLAARSEAERRSIHGATRAFLDEHLGPTVPPVEAGLDGGPPQGGIEALPPSAMSFRPDSYERIIPQVRVDDEGIVSGGIEDLAQGGFPIRTEPKRHVYYADQPGVDPETLQPYPKVPWEITSEEDIEQKKLDLRDLERQQTIDAEQRQEVSDIAGDLRRHELVKKEAIFREGIDQRAEAKKVESDLARMKAQYGLQLANQRQLADLEQSNWLIRSQRTHELGLIESGVDHKEAQEIAAYGSTRVPEGVERTIIDSDGNQRTVKVMAEISNWVDESGKKTVFTPRDDNGDFYVLETVEPPADVEAMLRERVQSIYARQRPRGRDNLTLWQAIDDNVDGISGILAPITAKGQELLDRNPQAQKLRDEIGLATEGFSNLMTQMGSYRSSSQAVSNILDRVGDLKGGLFAGDVALEERANAWLDAADRAVEAYTAPGAIDYNNAEQVSQLYALLSSALTLQEVLGMPNRPLIAGGYLTPEQRDQYRPGGRSGGDSRIPVGTSR